RILKGICRSAFTGRTVWWFICWSEGNFRRKRQRGSRQAVFLPPGFLLSWSRSGRFHPDLFTVSLKWTIYAFQVRYHRVVIARRSEKSLIFWGTCADVAGEFVEGGHNHSHHRNKYKLYVKYFTIYVSFSPQSSGTRPYILKSGDVLQPDRKAVLQGKSLSKPPGNRRGAAS
ncbi:MAG: hypothetical protein AB2404_13855, partial [Planifilum fimeticola]